MGIQRKRVTRRVVTLHAPLGEKVAGPLMSDIGKRLLEDGARRWWVSTEGLPDLTIMAEVEEPFGER